MKDSPRGLAVFDKAVQASGWGGPLPAGHAQGIAFCENVDSIVAQVAEVSVVNDVLRVHRVTAVIDCGMVINPDTLSGNVKELIEWAKQHPDKANYPSTSPAFTIAMEQLKLKSGMPAVMIPVPS